MTSTYILKFNFALFILNLALSISVIATEKERPRNCAEVVVSADEDFWKRYLGLDTIATDYVKSLEGDLKSVWITFVKQLASFRLSTDHAVVLLVSDFVEYARNCIGELANAKEHTPSQDEQMQVLARLLSGAASVRQGQRWKQEHQPIILRDSPEIFAKTFKEWFEKYLKAKDISRSEACIQMGFSRSRMTNHLKDKEQLSRRLLILYGLFFGVTAETIIAEIEGYSTEGVEDDE